MIQVRCIKKYRDKSGRIYGYRLADMDGRVQDVDAEDLKEAIENNLVIVSNLTLTSDRRLIDKKETILQDKKIFKNVPTQKIDGGKYIEKICAYLGFRFDVQRVKSVDGVIEYESPKRKLLGEDCTLTVEIKNNDTNVYVTSRLYELESSEYGKYLNEQLKNMKKILVSMGKTKEYYINHIGEFLSLAEEL